MTTIRKFRLDNGLTVILEPIEGVVSISVGLWARVGSRSETVEQYGYAHFIEHMLFKGTGRYSAQDIAKIVDRVGGQHNAATNREYTCYYINVISDYLEMSVDILADMFYGSLFDAEELGKEKRVILEEIRMYEDSPDDLIHDLFMDCMMHQHPLGHSILGTEESIKGARRDTLLSFFDTYYKNDNSILVITGRFDPDEAARLVEKYFSDNRRNGFVSPVNGVPAPARIYRRHIDRDLEQVHFCLGAEGLRKRDDDRWALYTLSTVLGGNMSSRLFQNIREKEGLCYSIYSFHSSYADSGIFGIYCGTAPENFRRTLDLILDECVVMLRTRITEQELADAKTYMKGNIALSFESTEVRMSQLA
ncbi:MAG TPA: pitrilysin family protein, partial [Spirochaetota bacterium]|nr:pitrilysin family protein [Spirochaetota bacterium]